MAKKKRNNYLLAIVGIVIVLGVTVLVLNSGSNDLTGEATAAKTAKATTAKTVMAVTQNLAKVIAESYAAASAECRDSSYDCDGTWSYDYDQGTCLCMIGGIATYSESSSYTAGVDSASSCCSAGLASFFGDSCLAQSC